MKDTDLQRLVEFRTRCASEPGLRVLYEIDHEG